MKGGRKGLPSFIKIFHFLSITRGGAQRLMENSILNFLYVFLNTSLTPFLGPLTLFMPLLSFPNPLALAE